MCLPAFRQAYERKSGFYDLFLGCFNKPQQRCKIFKPRCKIQWKKKKKKKLSNIIKDM